MKFSLIAGPGLIAGGFACAAYAEVSVPPPAAKPDITATPKQEAKADKKDDAENRVRIEFDTDHRLITAFYSNVSQARLKVYAVSRFDPEIAKPREYFVSELYGAAIIEPLKLDANEA